MQGTKVLDRTTKHTESQDLFHQNINLSQNLSYESGLVHPWTFGDTIESWKKNTVDYNYTVQKFKNVMYIYLSFQTTHELKKKGEIDIDESAFKD